MNCHSLLFSKYFFQNLNFKTTSSGNSQPAASSTFVQNRPRATSSDFPDHDESAVDASAIDASTFINPEPNAQSTILDPNNTTMNMTTGIGKENIRISSFI